MRLLRAHGILTRFRNGPIGNNHYRVRAQDSQVHDASSELRGLEFISEKGANQQQNGYQSQEADRRAAVNMHSLRLTEGASDATAVVN